MTQYVLPKIIPDDKRSMAVYSRIYGNIINQIDDESGQDLYIEVRRATRTLKQNNYLWGVVYPTVKKYMDLHKNVDVSDEAIHEATKQSFLLARVEQVGKRKIKVYKSTKNLTRLEFSDYLECLFRWAGGFGCSIPEPEWNWRAKKSKAA